MSRTDDLLKIAMEMIEHQRNVIAEQKDQIKELDSEIAKLETELSLPIKTTPWSPNTDPWKSPDPWGQPRDYFQPPNWPFDPITCKLDHEVVIGDVGLTAGKSYGTTR